MQFGRRLDPYFQDQSMLIEVPYLLSGSQKIQCRTILRRGVMNNGERDTNILPAIERMTYVSRAEMEVYYQMGRSLVLGGLDGTLLGGSNIEISYNHRSKFATRKIIHFPPSNMIARLAEVRYE